MKRTVAAGLLLVCATTDNGTPHAGTLSLTLTSGGTTDGAVVVIVSGGPVTSVAAPAAYQVASNADGEGTHIMVLGNIGSGVIATITVPDASQAGAYVATVVQVSDRGTFVLLDPVRYHVTLAP